jgi:hypothetical protein
MFYINNIIALKSIYFTHFESLVKYGLIFEVIHPTVERCLLYKSELAELWLVHSLELRAEVSLKN